MKYSNTKLRSNSISNYSRVFIDIIEKYTNKIHHPTNQNDPLPKIIQSYEFINKFGLTSHKDDEMNRFLSQEIKQSKSTINTSNQIEDKEDLDTQYHLKRLQKIHLINFKPGQVNLRLNKSKSTESKLLLSPSQENYSHIIPENTLLPILLSSPLRNNRLSEKKVKLIQLKIKENVEHNIEKRKRIYDQHYYKRIPDALNNLKSIKIIKNLKQKYPLSEIKNNISQIETAMSKYDIEAKRNLCNTNKSKHFIRSKLRYLILKDKIADKEY